MALDFCSVDELQENNLTRDRYKEKKINRPREHQRKSKTSLPQMEEANSSQDERIELK